MSGAGDREASTKRCYEVVKKKYGSCSHVAYFMYLSYNKEEPFKY